MKALALVLAVALLPLAAAPAAAPAAKKRPHCGVVKKKKRAARLCRGTLRSRASLQLLGAPGGFATPSPFATAGGSAPAPSATPDAGSEPPPPDLPPVVSNPRAVQVRATEYRLELSKSSVLSGTVKVEFNSSRAEDPHDLRVVREDGTGPLYSFGEQPSGAVSSKSLALGAGRWKLFCSLTGHQALGMETTLTVSGG